MSTMTDAQEAAEQATLEACQILTHRAEAMFEQDKPEIAVEILRALLEIAPADHEARIKCVAIIRVADAAIAGEGL